MKLTKNRGYLTLMAAQTISSLGDWLSIVAIITLVGLKWEATPMQVSLVILCLALPMALLGPVAGTVADRLNRKMLMMVSDLVRAGLILGLAFAETLWLVYVCLFTIGAFSAVFVPAKNGKLKELVAPEQMKSAMSITSMIDSSTKIMGPLLSGLLVAAFGAKIVFFIDSASFLLSAIFIFLLPKGLEAMNEVQEEDSNRTSFKQEFLTGLSFIKLNSFIKMGLAFLGISLMILQLADSQIIVLIRDLSTASPDLFGYIVTASGLGMFLAGWRLAKRTDYQAFPNMLAGVSGLGISFGMMAVLTYFDVEFSIVWGPLFGLTGGFAASHIFVPFQATVQVETPVHMTGRVFGVINSVMTMATIIGPLLGGWLATQFGAVPTFIVTATILVVISFAGYLAKNKVERGRVHDTESKSGTPRATTS
ncbi:putative MFS-type transporter YfiS [Halobacillus andaensis]|uniref:MFS-type transporter YfiS n=1 Tax=Halobacillus andaensis TaxID=1176239 RepID=A0A917ETY5_HALAA|nr:MFS transporter [Halobacillus andaensis]MBP2003767.1 MFS family permease [Halobacillus andaensis]GGF13082.1 putative MFS-type transporter YfiS [Halobacillus andaensis]